MNYSIVFSYIYFFNNYRAKKCGAYSNFTALAGSMPDANRAGKIRISHATNATPALSAMKAH